MGNIKSYTFCTPVFEGETPPTADEIMEWARTDYVIVGLIAPQDANTKHAFIGYVSSSSMSADHFLERLRERLPNRWLHVTRFDADMPTFGLISVDEHNNRESATYALDGTCARSAATTIG